MSPQKSELNSIMFRRRENDDDYVKLMAEIAKRRWNNRFDLWLFVSVWVAITPVAGLGIILHN